MDPEEQSISSTSSSSNNEREKPSINSRPVTVSSKKGTSTNTNNDVPIEKVHSAPSHKSLSKDHGWSLNDGYSYHGDGDADGDEPGNGDVDGNLEAGGEKNGGTVGVTAAAAAAAAAAKAGPDDEDPFTVDWDEGDPMNPRNMGKARRWLITLIVSMGSLCVTCTSSMYTTTYDQLMPEFGCSRIVATLGLSFFIWGLGVGPLFLSPLSEFYGRRIIYVVSFSLFVIFLVPCAVAKNTQTMLVCRFFNGLVGSAFLSVAGGTVGDLFARHELGPPMMIYTASPFVGPEVGPLVGGFICQFTHWRWTFYVLLIWAGALLTAIIFLVPETYHSVLLRRKAQTLRKETGDQRWIAPIEKLNRSVAQTVGRSIYRPLLLLILEPMCLNLCIFSAILLGIIYLFFGAFQLVFASVYGMTLWQRGLCFLGLFVGMALAIMTDPLWRRNYARLERGHQKTVVGMVDGVEEFLPEWRLPPAIAGAPLVTIGLFIFAWTIYSHVHWIGPVIGSGVFGAGTILVYSGVFTFLVDAYPVYAASALAANSFARSAFGGVFPLFGIQMYNRLNYHWATSLLAFLTLAMAPFPYVFFRYGAQIRKKSRFAR